MRYQLGHVLLNLFWLILVAAIGAFVAVLLIDAVGVKFISAWSKYLTFLYGILGGWVILLITKLQDLDNVDGIKSKQYEKLDQIVRQKSKRLWALIGFYLTSACVALSLPVFLEINHTFGYLAAFLTCTMFVISIYFAFRISTWFEELRKFRWQIKQHLAAEKERNELIEELNSSEFHSTDNLDGSKRICH